MPFFTPLRVLVFLAAAIAALGLMLEPELLFQGFVRGGFLLAGIAITLALRPRDVEEVPISPSR